MASISRLPVPPLSPAPRRSAASWLALLTATTVQTKSDIVRAEVHCTREFQAVSDARPHRLIVQVYPRRAVVGGRIQPWARPSASAQRAVRSDDLVSGVLVPLVDFGQLSVDTHDPTVVVAWVEEGFPELDLDGFDARPASGAPWAFATLRPGSRSARLRFGARCAA